MLSRKQIQGIHELRDASARRKSRHFLVEGPKLLSELIETAWTIQGIFGLQEWVELNHPALEKRQLKAEIISPAELEKISALVTPNQVVAVVSMPPIALDWDLLHKGLTLMLDGIQDPGNLGTILRIADWFGISQVICSASSADVFNPKVVQASMGSVFRVKVFYEKLDEFLGDLPGEIPVYGAFLDGTNIQDCQLQNRGILIIGSESHGISPEVAPLVNHRIKIPSFPHLITVHGAESLNASVATGILCYEFRTRGKSGTLCC